MPRLPTAEDFGARPIPQVRQARPAPVSTASAEALQFAGRQLTGLGDELMQQEAIERDRADTLRAEESYNSLIEQSLDLTDGEDGFRRKRGAEVANRPLAADYWGRYEQSARDLESKLGNDAQRAKFRARAKAHGLQYRRDLLQHIGREAEVYGQQVYTNALGVEVRSAAAHWDDPMTAAASVERLNAVVNERAEAEDWDDDTLMLERAKALSGLHSAVVVSALDNDNLKYADDYFKKISPEVDEATRHQLSRAIDGKRKEQLADQRQQQVLARLELQETVGDVQAAYLAAGRYDGPIPTKADFVAAYGPTDAEKRYASFQSVVAVGRDIQDAALANPQEQAAILARNRPALAEGFKEGQERYQILAASVAKLNKEREDDPASYVLRHLPKVQGAYQAMSADPANADAAREFAREVSAASESLGIQNRAVLPAQMADSIAASYEIEPLGIAAERERWGEQWPAVWQQLAPKLGGTAFVIGMGMSPEPARKLAELSKLKPEELKNNLPADDKPGDYDREARKALDQALMSYRGQPGAEKLGSSLVEATTKLAMHYRRTGKSISEAAEQAANETFNGRYGFIERNDYVVRVPQPYDADDVDDALSIVTGDLKASGQPRVDEAVWVTLPADQDGKLDAGVALMWMGGVVKKPDGTDAIYTWDELLNRKATVRRARMDELDRSQSIAPTLSGSDAR